MNPPRKSTPADAASRAALIEHTIAAVEHIRREMIELANQDFSEQFAVAPTYRVSARNLLHYLALRRHDVRDLQNQLAELGLSSLGRAEAHVMATLNAVLTTLHALLGRTWSPPVNEPATPSFSTGQHLLSEHTELLLGAAPHERGVRIMVTMPSEAANDYTLVHDLLQRGMNCMRINCAHGDTGEWLHTIEHLRRAQQALGKPCKIIMDLAGPKLRTGPLTAEPAVLKIRPVRNAFGKTIAPARVWLTAENAPHQAPSAATASVPIAAKWFAQLRAGERLHFVDTRNAERTLEIIDVSARGCWAALHKTAYIAAGTELRRETDEKNASEEGSVGALPAPDSAIILQRGDALILTRDLNAGRPATHDKHGQLLSPAVIGCTLPEVLHDVRAGERIWLDDGKIGGIIETVESDCVHIRITQTRVGGEKLRADKGINLPDSDLHLAALTAEDCENLQFVMQHADMVALSFVNSRADVEALQHQMEAIADRKIGLVLKIETQRGFYNLPEMVLAAMKNPACGIMIARGDLAVECGFERLAEVQEEILWICEAAHIPVIWATQVLENLAKEGLPSRAEITDAAMANRAECVMLNKGPHIVSALQMLDDILQRMQTHHAKKSPMLRELKLAHTFPEKPKSQRRKRKAPNT